MVIRYLMCALSLVAALAWGQSAGAVTPAWVEVGAPGNLCDAQFTGCYGAVPYEYSIAQYEVTNAQYVEFLNAVGATDPSGLYNDAMGSDAEFGGIIRINAVPPFGYAAKPGFENKPVVYVSFYDALRFVNWLENSQPMGAQDASTTEDGSYTITGPGIAANTIVRNSQATFVLPSEDEWYKAAYFDAVSGTYYDYPVRISMPFEPACVPPALDTGSAANCLQAVGALTDVGAYAASFGPFSTYDQGGNATEWNETVVDMSKRGLRGGSWASNYLNLGSFFRGSGTPTTEQLFNGFRVAMLVPEPIRALGEPMAILALAALVRRRRR